MRINTKKSFSIVPPKKTGRVRMAKEAETEMEDWFAKETETI